MKRLFTLLLAWFLSTTMLFAGNVVMNMQITAVNDDGSTVTGPQNILVKLQNSAGTTLWEETQENVLFISGIAGFKLGDDTPLNTILLAEADVKFVVQVGTDGETKDVVLYAVPYALYSLGADVVDTIFREDMFRMDISSGRIGFGGQSPVVKADVAGGLRVGDTTLESAGIIRYHEGRLQGRKNDEWVNLDFGFDEDYVSKWTIQGNTLYTLNRPVGIGVPSPSVALEVSGDVHIENDLIASRKIVEAGEIQLGVSNSFDASGNVDLQNLLMTNNNTWAVSQIPNQKDLRVSGGFFGDGRGLVNIGSSSIVDGAVASRNIASGTMTSGKIATDAVDARVVANGAITKNKLQPGFVVTAQHLATGSVTGRAFQSGAITSDDMTIGFVLNADAIVDHAYDSSNIVDDSIFGENIATGAILQEHIVMSDQSPFGPNAIKGITTDKFATGSVETRHIVDGNIQAFHIQNSSITPEKFLGVLSTGFGGTGATFFNAKGLLFAGQAGLQDAVNSLSWDNTKHYLGLGTSTPGAPVHVLAGGVTGDIAVHSQSAKPAELRFQHREYPWALETDPQGLLRLWNVSSSENVLVMSSGASLAIGTATPSAERVWVGGGLRLSSAKHATANPGTLEFNGNVFRLHDSGGWRVIGPASWAGVSYGTSLVGNAGYASMLGGNGNSIAGAFGTIGGGVSHTIPPQAYVVIGGGQQQSVSDGLGAVSAGIGGGRSNRVNVTNTFLGRSIVLLGGRDNTASQAFSFVGSGQNNFLNSGLSGIWGGQLNLITGGDHNVIVGGQENEITQARYTTIAGGFDVRIQSDYQIGGGDGDGTFLFNWIAGSAANPSHYVVSAGGSKQRLSGQHVAALGARNLKLSGQWNAAAAVKGVAVSGRHNAVFASQGTSLRGQEQVAIHANNSRLTGTKSSVFSANGARISGRLHSVSGESHRVQGELQTVLGGRSHRVEGLSHALLSGHSNRVSGRYHSGIGGDANHVTGHSNGVLGGNQNRVSAEASAVISGTDTMASAPHSIAIQASKSRLAGMYSALVSATDAALSGSSSTILGGTGQRLTGDRSGVVGGRDNVVRASSSLALGRGAQVMHEGSFVWSDGFAGEPVRSDVANQFKVNAHGEIRFLTGEDAVGARLAKGSGAWSHVSDRNKKRDFRSIRYQDYLANIETLPVSTWAYRSSPSVKHMGPTSQDFYKRFSLGVNDRQIDAVDADGVLMAGIKGVLLQMDRRLEGQKKEAKALAVAQPRLLRLHAHVSTLDAKLADLDAGLAAVSSSLSASVERQQEQQKHLSRFDKQLSRLERMLEMKSEVKR